MQILLSKIILYLGWSCTDLIEIPFLENAVQIHQNQLTKIRLIENYDLIGI